jgi:hypothetical protein
VIAGNLAASAHSGMPLTKPQEKESTMRGRIMFFVIVPLVALAGAAIAGGGGGKLLYADARMIIEFNDTDQDVGIQMFIDGEPWKLLRVFDPEERKILEIRGTRSLRLQGLSELFFESSEPSLDELSLEEFLERFPEGVYELEGVTIDGREIEGEATFTHAIPEGPVLLSPPEGSMQDPDNTVVSWEEVPDPEDSTIEAYQVIVTQLLDVLPKRTFSVHVPASATSVEVPATFMQRDAEYEFEVLAIEAGGNQTISAGSFSTLP